MIHTLHYHIHEVTGYVNWLYFFHAWGFPSRYGSIAEVHGCEACRSNWLQAFPEEERSKAKEAIRLYDDAQALLGFLDEQYRTHAIVGLFPANGEDDDIILWTDDGRSHRLPLLRQQNGTPCLCLSDFLRPLSGCIQDTIGLFCATVDEGFEQSFPDDDYRHMLAQTLADRLAEATAERAHEETRTKLWGYAPNEHLTTSELFKEQYQGRRPAIGYPSLPDQSLNFILSDLLNMPSVGISLTESGAMRPHASTSGLMFSHPAARHFSVGCIGQDQIQDYANRRGMPEEEVRKFLSSNIVN